MLITKTAIYRISVGFGLSVTLQRGRRNQNLTVPHSIEFQARAISPSKTVMLGYENGIMIIDMKGHLPQKN